MPIEELVHRRESLRLLINALIGQQWLPSYPVYVLSAVQATERNIEFDHQISTYGAYYELFIRLALQRNRNPVHSGIIHSYLSHLAFSAYDKGANRFTDSDLISVHRAFEHKYRLDVNLKSIIDELIVSRILRVANDTTHFSYPYLYYYFIASWIRDNLSDDSVVQRVKLICREAYLEENANILLFLSHLSRHPVIVNELIAVAKSFFPTFEPASLDDDMPYLKDIGKVGPNITFIDGEGNISRRRYLENLDAIEEQMESDSHGVGSSEEEAGLYNPQSAQKIIRILGQLLKNFPASLEADVKSTIVIESYALGLRALTAMLWVLAQPNLGLADVVAEYLKSVDPDDSDEAIETKTRETMVFLAEVVSFGTVMQVAESLGSSRLRRTYDDVARSYTLPSHKLLNIAIRLDQSIEFPETTVTTVSREFSSATVASEVLKMLVMRHFHLFAVSGPARQRIAHELGIAVAPRIGADPARRVV